MIVSKVPFIARKEKSMNTSMMKPLSLLKKYYHDKWYGNEKIKDIIKSRSFRRYLECVAFGIDGKKVKIVFHESGKELGWTDGKVINVNLFPEVLKDCTVEELVCSLIALPFHEKLHLCYTDFKTIKNINYFLHDIHNIVEDGRIERIGGFKMPGWNPCLYVLNKKLYEMQEKRDKQRNQPLNEFQQLYKALWNYNIVGILPDGFTTKKAEDAWKKIRKLSLECRYSDKAIPAFEKSKKIAEILSEFKSTQGYQTVCVIRAFEDSSCQGQDAQTGEQMPNIDFEIALSPQTSKSPQNKDKSEKDEDNQTGGSPDKNGEDSDSNNATESAEKSEKEADSEKADNESDSKDSVKEDENSDAGASRSAEDSNSSDKDSEEQNTEDADDSDNGSENSSADSLSSGKGEKSNKQDSKNGSTNSSDKNDSCDNSQEAEGSDDSDTCNNPLDSEDDREVQEFLDRLSDDLESVEDEYNAEVEADKQDSEYVIRFYGSCNDRTETSFENDSKYELYKEQLTGIISNMKTKLFKTINFNLEETTRKLSRGKVDGKSLTNVINGRICKKRKEKSDETNLNITFLLDKSGSMSGSRANNTLQAAIVMQEALQALKIPSTFLSFGSDVDMLKHWKQSKYRRSAICNYRISGNTYLNRGLQVVQQVVKEQSQYDPMLFVITDGEPDNYDSSQRLIKSLTHNGCQVYGIGIGRDVKKSTGKFVGLFGSDKYILVEELSDLPLELTKVVKRNLLRT